MGRNKTLRTKIAGCERVIADHNDKIRDELTNDYPNEEHIRGWRREIDVQKAILARLTRRLKREW